MNIKTNLRTKIFKIPFLWRFEKIQKFFLNFADILEDSLSDRVKKILSNYETVTYLQIGANDGVSSDQIYELAKESANWAGLLIEPLPWIYEKLVKNYQNTRYNFANIAIFERDGDLTLYHVDHDFKDKTQHPESHYYDQIASFDRAHIIKHYGEKYEKYIKEYKVPCLTLKSCLEKFKIDKIDIIQIDVEGYDWKVLQQLDLEKYSPKIIIYEHMHLSFEDKKSSVDFLISHGYDVTDYVCDYMAIKKVN